VLVEWFSTKTSTRHADGVNFNLSTRVHFELIEQTGAIYSGDWSGTSSKTLELETSKDYILKGRNNNSDDTVEEYAHQTFISK